jgi:hypothetical protein
MSRPYSVAELNGHLPPADAREVLVTPTTHVRATLERVSPKPVAALVPDMEAWVRDASDRGMVGAAMARARSAGLRGLVRAARVGLPLARRILAGDPAAAIPVLLELELSQLGGLRPDRLVLAAGITDLAVGTGDASMIASYARYARRRVKAEAWVETRNLGHLLRMLRRRGLEIDGVVTALNPKGLGMKPDLASCLDELGRTTVRIWARDVTAGGAVSHREGMAFAAALGAAAVITDGRDGRDGS